MKKKVKKKVEPVNNSNEKLLLSDVIKRLSDMQRYSFYTEGGIGGYYSNIVNDSAPIYKEKNKDGKWVCWEDIKKLLNELNVL